jgi:hypothetical protein
MDYNSQTILCINPPPEDLCCQCCGRHMRRLNPLGGSGDPLGGDLSGALLVRNLRTIWPDPTLEERRQGQEELRQPDGPAEVRRRNPVLSEPIMLTASWECRDCFLLSPRAYWEIRAERFEGWDDSGSA